MSQVVIRSANHLNEAHVAVKFVDSNGVRELPLREGTVLKHRFPLPATNRSAACVPHFVNASNLMGAGENYLVSTKRRVRVKVSR